MQHFSGSEITLVQRFSLGKYLDTPLYKEINKFKWIFVSFLWKCIEQNHYHTVEWEFPANRDVMQVKENWNHPCVSQMKSGLN